MPYRLAAGGAGVSTALTGGVAWPMQFSSSTAAPALSSTQLLIDASGEKAAAIFAVPKTGTLDKCEFYVTNVTGAAGGLRVSFQDVDAATGFPDGTQDQYRAGVAVSANTWCVPGLMTADGTDGGAKRSVTRGDLLAVVVEFESFAASDAVRVVAPLTTNLASTSGNFPYTALFTAAWAAPGNVPPFVVLKYNDGTYATVHQGSIPATALSTHAINTGTTPDEAGAIFQVPFACKVDRLWVRIDADAAADVILYGSDGTTPLATVSIDSDVRGVTAGSWHEALLPSDVSLAAATSYRAVVKPTSGSSVTLYSFDVASAAIMAALPGGSAMHFTERTDAGAWSETTTRRPFISVGISAVTV